MLQCAIPAAAERDFVSSRYPVLNEAAWGRSDCPLSHGGVSAALLGVIPAQVIQNVASGRANRSRAMPNSSFAN